MLKLAGLVFTVAAITSSVDAHSLFTTLYVNNVNQGDGTCIRMPKDSRTATNPVTDFNDNAMVCGFDGTQGVKRVCPVPQGSQLGFAFRTFPDGTEPGSIEPSHKGPCAVYMKSVTSASESSGEGDGWFKIWEEGYDTRARKWCSDKVIDNDGVMNIKIPDDLAGGNYLVRTELLALHEADKSPPDPQFYIGCAQIFLQSTANSVPTPDSMVSIPGYVRKSDPSVLFNIYVPRWPYPMPGPAPYTKGVPSERTAAAAFHGGLLPPKTVAVNGNWWGTEQEPYNTESGCWGATTNCYKQVQTCYESAPPTGFQGCRTYESKCSKMKSHCSQGDFNGPPDQGKILTAGVRGNIDENAPPMSPTNQDQSIQTRFRRIKRSSAYV